MECKGNILSVSRDLHSDKLIATFSLDATVKEIQDIRRNDELSVVVKKYRKKRSLDANAYCWVLMTKIATAVGSSKDDVYEEMLQKYGSLMQDGSGYIVVTVKTFVDMSKVPGHWKYIRDNGEFSAYAMIKGSSEYDTKEMSDFIDRIIEEAKDLGIEALPPDELERMKSTWKA